MLEDDSFQLDTPRIRKALAVAKKVRDWIYANEKEAKFFEDQVLKRMKNCFEGGASSSVRREKVWGKYHKLRSSDAYREFWKAFLVIVGCETVDDPAFYQYISHHMFKRCLMEHFPLNNHPQTSVAIPSLTFEEKNVIRYTAGYVCAKLYKKLRISTGHGDLFHGIEDMIAEEGDEEDVSATWIDIVDRGGLFHVNDMAYAFFVSLEEVVRQYLKISEASNMKPGTKDKIVKSILEDENVNLQWSAIRVELDEKASGTLLSMIASEWITLRGFSFAGSFMELYKLHTKQSLQKSKGIRTKLQNKGKENKEKTSTS